MYINCRQFVTKKNAPDCTKLPLKFKKKLPGVKYPGLLFWGGGTPSQTPPPARRFAPWFLTRCQYRHFFM